VSIFWHNKKSRIYPIKKDERGWSARRRAFDAFNSGKRPADVTQQVDVSLKTACRYFADWKKLPKNLGIRYEAARRIVKQETELSEEVISLLSEHLGMARYDVIERLEKPWGIKQLILGKWTDYRQQQVYNRQEARLSAALYLVRFVESSGMSSEDLKEYIEMILNKASRSSQTEEYIPSESLQPE